MSGHAVKHVEEPKRTISLKPELRKELEELVLRFPRKEGGLLNVLRVLEREFSYVDSNVVKLAAELCEMPPAKAWGVFTFYSTFRTHRDGKHNMWVCSTLPCALRGSDKLFDHIHEQLDCDDYGTSSDKLITLKKAECLGACGTAPCLQLNDDYYENVSHEEASRIIRDLRNGVTRPSGSTTE